MEYIAFPVALVFMLLVVWSGCRSQVRRLECRISVLASERDSANEWADAQKSLVEALERQIAAMNNQIAAMKNLETEQGKYISTLKRYAGLPED
jgi:hypothetical protein